MSQIPFHDHAAVAPKRNPRRRRRVRVVVGLVVLAAAGGFVAASRNSWFRGNFGVVDPGRVYRSAQPEGGLPRLIAERRLGSVLNLRGGSPADPWYVAEVQATRAGGVAFYDFPMSATRRPTRRELLVLLDLLGRCRYPLLIHCKSGSDRTALASALYLMAECGTPPEEARRAFTLGHGHVPWLGPERLHEPLIEYAAWLRARSLAHTPGRFRAWVERDYRDPTEPGGTRAAFVPLREGTREPSYDRVIPSVARSPEPARR